MKRFGSAAILAIYLYFSLQVRPQQAASTSHADHSAVLLAVVKDWASLAGYTGGWPTAATPRVPVEFLAEITASGNWIDPTLHCDSADSSGCRHFLNQDVNRTSQYWIITDQSQGTTVSVLPVRKIDDCWYFGSSGLLSSTIVGPTAVASDHPEFFDVAPVLQSASADELSIVYTGLLHLGPPKIRTLEGIKIRKVKLEGMELFIAERHSTSQRHLGIVFAIGRIIHGQFELLRWNENGGEDGDTVESALGVIRFKNGREFLVTTESDPEGQQFYAYGIEKGNLKIVFKGGGSGC